MAGIVPTVGENRIAERALKGSALDLKLFVNDYTPVDGTVAGSLTEMSTHGYAGKSLAAVDWSVSQVSAKAEAVQDPVTWTFTAASPVTVYGYWIADPADAVPMFVERFTTPRVVENDGDEIIFTPKVRFSKE